MATYLMFGTYDRESVQGISEKRTQKAAELLEKHQGRLVSGYALLGEQDLVLVTEFPGTEQVVAASLELTKLTGISFSSSPALTIEDFDKLAP